MGINDLPKPGINFRATAGAGNFKRKLSGAARYGDLNILDPKNQKAVVDEVKRQETKIRRNKFTSLSQGRALSRIMASDKTATDADRRKIKEVLKHLGAPREEKKAPQGFKFVKTDDGKSHLVEKGVKLIRSSGEGFLSKRQIFRNLFYRDRNDSGEGSGRAAFTKQYAGGAEVKSFGVYGAKKDVGVKKDKVGFAADSQNKSPDNSASKNPAAGIKPLDL